LADVATGGTTILHFKTKSLLQGAGAVPRVRTTGEHRGSDVWQSIARYARRVEPPVQAEENR